MKTVEELIRILQELPPKSRVMVGDRFEGTIRDLDTVELQLSNKYWAKYEKNGERVVEIEVNKTDEFWESFNKEKEEENRKRRLRSYVDEAANKSSRGLFER
jgi:hypothetical protein